MLMRFNPANWYWLASDGRIMSSASRSIVPANDPTYGLWLTGGNSPTPWPSDTTGGQTIAALQDVLTPCGIYVDLGTYANVKQWTKAQGGYMATVAGAQVPIATTTESLALISGKAARLQQANPPATVQWQTGPASFVTIAAADFLTMAVAVTDFVQSTFDTLATVLAGIASGQITMFSQVDAAFA
jgi:hypothetical protein